MIWSYSSGRAFQACQRQWYFQNVVGVGQAKAPDRRKVYLLGKHDSVSAWRGRLVDELITERIVEPFNEGDDLPDLKTMIGHADKRFRKQLDFARAHPQVESTLDIKAAGSSFALLRDVEQVTDEDIELAWEEVKQAFRTLYQSEETKTIIKSADYLVSQKALQYRLLDGLTVKGVPDLIAFRDDEAPTILDWKVHVQGTHDAWMQLAIYAICLEKCKMHVDWAVFFDGVARNRESMRLVEVQLLTNVVRDHRLNADHFDRAEAFMQSSSYEMACLLDGRKNAELETDEFDVARFPEACDACSYRPICWEVGHAN